MEKRKKVESHLSIQPPICSSTTLVMPTVIENVVCTRRADGTTVRSRCGPSVRGRATDTCPRARRDRARRRSRCGRRHRRRARTHSCPAPRVYKWGHRYRSWPRIQLDPLSGPTGLCRARGSCSRLCRTAAAPR